MRPRKPRWGLPDGVVAHDARPVGQPVSHEAQRLAVHARERLPAPQLPRRKSQRALGIGHGLRRRVAEHRQRAKILARPR
jgi:hypothetical protein